MYNVPGRTSGKSTDANMIEKKMYQPKIAMAKATAPAAKTQFSPDAVYDAVPALFPAAAACPALALYQKNAVKRPNTGTSRRKTRKKMTFVRVEQSRKHTQSKPMKMRKQPEA